ncbi:MAG: hypothetical protein JNM52_07980, partial [Betaproteobacteria bacterium]|nr:hypothetical protein [Betaproteobacteria bacterium]
MMARLILVLSGLLLPTFVHAAINIAPAAGQPLSGVAAKSAALAQHLTELQSTNEQLMAALAALLMVLIGLTVWWVASLRDKSKAQPVVKPADRIPRQYSRRSDAPPPPNAVVVAAEAAKQQLRDAWHVGLPVVPDAGQVAALTALDGYQRRIAECDYRFVNWESRAFAAYVGGQFDLAAHYFREASISADARPIQVLHALFARCVMLSEVHRGEEVIAVCDDVVSRFGDSLEVALCVDVAQAMAIKVAVLNELGRREEAMSTLDQVIERFGERDQLELQLEVARALVNKGIALGQQGQAEAEFASYDQVVTHFGDSADVALSEQVLRAMINMAATLGQLGRVTEEIEMYDEILDRFGEATEPA